MRRSLSDFCAGQPFIVTCISFWRAQSLARGCSQLFLSPGRHRQPLCHVHLCECNNMNTWFTRNVRTAQRVRDVHLSFIFSAFSRRLRSRARSKNARMFLSWSISASSSVVPQPTVRKSSCLPDSLQVGSSCVARSRVQNLSRKASAATDTNKMAC